MKDPVLILYDTLTQREKPFNPKNPHRICFYVCGPTVYDDPHLGHARSAVVFDLLFRLLRRIYKGDAVVYIRNYTDVDDKIIARAQEENLPVEAITTRYIAAYDRAVAQLNCLPPTHTPRVTEFIPEIIRFIEGLVRRGVAYVVEGAVFYHVNRFPNYGKLSHHSLEELSEGHRIEVDPRKRHPLDFALWKEAKPGEPFWESPWGPGRPGWHIECSVMASHFSQGTLDLHGGGQDLIFPHHENEIAQYEALYEGEFCRHWMHNGFIRFRSQKMSKSLKNFVTVEEILRVWPRSVLRYFLLQAHYRSPLDFSPEALVEAAKALFRLYELFEPLWLERNHLSPQSLPLQELSDLLETARYQFLEGLFTDLNTPRALARVFSALRLINRHKNLRFYGIPPGADGDRYLEVLTQLYTEFKELLGILAEPYPRFLKGWNARGLSYIGYELTEVEMLLKEREELRKVGNYTEADQIRQRLLTAGIEIEDLPQTVRYRLQPEVLLKFMP